ncbi:hypothetical protein [Burkholderia plantarii]|nr:hypothetical protein [Burkholderia plantarii]
MYRSCENPTSRLRCHRDGRLLFALDEHGVLAVKTADERYDLWRLNRM